jgi:hypothetical protein
MGKPKNDSEETKNAKRAPAWEVAKQNEADKFTAQCEQVAKLRKFRLEAEEAKKTKWTTHPAARSE